MVEMAEEVIPFLQLMKKVIQLICLVWWLTLHLGQITIKAHEICTSARYLWCFVNASPMKSNHVFLSFTLLNMWYFASIICCIVDGKTNNGFLFTISSLPCWSEAISSSGIDHFFFLLLFLSWLDTSLDRTILCANVFHWLL